MIQKGTKPEDDKTYSLAEAAKKMNYEFGRQILYQILRNLEIVNTENEPDKELVKQGILCAYKPRIKQLGSVEVPKTKIRGKKGLDYIKEKVDLYLKDNPVPKIEKHKRIGSQYKMM